MPCGPGTSEHCCETAVRWLIFAHTDSNKNQARPQPALVGLVGALVGGLGDLVGKVGNLVGMGVGALEGLAVVGEALGATVGTMLQNMLLLSRSRAISSKLVLSPWSTKSSR